MLKNYLFKRGSGGVHKFFLHWGEISIIMKKDIDIDTRPEIWKKDRRQNVFSKIYNDLGRYILLKFNYALLVRLLNVVKHLIARVTIVEKFKAMDQPDHVIKLLPYWHFL